LHFLYDDVLTSAVNLMLQCVRPMVGLTALVRKAHVYEVLLKLMSSVDAYVTC